MRKGDLTAKPVGHRATETEETAANLGDRPVEFVFIPVLNEGE